MRAAKIIQNLFPKRTGAGRPFPLKPVYIIGDVHGRYDLLLELFEQIDQDVARNRLDKISIVLVGDYIDRGHFSRQVLRLLEKANAEAPGSFICLRGNHEQMLLDFLSDPRPETALWLRYGGDQTLVSFGIGVPPDLYDTDKLKEVAHQLIRALGKQMCIWLHNLPSTWSSGNLVCVHAAADPNIPIADQEDDVFLWGHNAFLKTPRQDDIWVAHGHTVYQTAHITGGRIAVDTGAYKTGKLSAAKVMPDGKVSFLTATSD
ncbi:metallophosphoesterase family protein [Pseudaestuariivita rosea]|uniref:metallophosphoesterase family protein n=1 Tax=Pseudaestuariivita rosea TaxID=2763263 RepID=UPI001ABB0F0F|nr:metallophosphoesterase family protein [Pseudaestuariivita rosea]